MTASHCPRASDHNMAAATDQTATSERLVTRRSVAKGAAWAAPVLTAAALAPGVAASPAVCTPASQQTINNAMTLATRPSYPLRLDYYQPGGRNNGVGGATWINLNNLGSRTIRATPTNPIIVEIKILTVANVPYPNETRKVQAGTTVGWGEVISPANLEVGVSSPVTMTWRITQDILPGAQGGTAADMSIYINNRGLLAREPLVHLTARMTSFGVNDDLAAQDLPALSTLGLGAQQAPCTTYYQSQAALNTGPNKARYTLQSSGPLQSGPQAWPVGATADSQTLGNDSGALFPGREALDGVW